MTQKDSKTVLWENLLALMLQRYGKENLGRVAKESGVGAATMTRIKDRKTSIGTDHLDKIAKALKVETWQLICPKGSQANWPDLQQYLKWIEGDPTHPHTPNEIRAVVELLEAIPDQTLSDAAWAASRALIPYLPRRASSAPATSAPTTDATQENTSS